MLKMMKNSPLQTNVKGGRELPCCAAEPHFEAIPLDVNVKRRSEDPFRKKKSRVSCVILSFSPLFFLHTSFSILFHHSIISSARTFAQRNTQSPVLEMGKNNFTKSHCTQADEGYSLINDGFYLNFKYGKCESSRIKAESEEKRVLTS